MLTRDTTQHFTRDRHPGSPSKIASLIVSFQFSTEVGRDVLTALQEETFHNRPSIKIPISDMIKGYLVDDWENVTKSQQLVPLPHPHPVNDILNDYLDHERPNRVAGSAAMDILEEVVTGIREYFDKALGRILLYR